MTLAEIMQKITELSATDRAVLRHELEEMLSKPETQSVTPETAKALHAEQAEELIPGTVCARITE